MFYSMGGGYSVYKHCLVWEGMPNKERRLDDKEIKELIRTHKAWMLRNCYDWDCGVKTNFWEVICDISKPIEEFPSKTRNQIRRCLRDCCIKPISNIELIEKDGYKVFIEAFKRYREVTISLASRVEWEKEILEDCTHEFWGVFEKESGRLIAWAMNTIKDSCVSYSTLKATPELMNKHYPYFGLLFEMNKYYLGELKYKYVSDGWRSITAHSNIQPFLEKNFGFRKSYCRMKLHYVWWLQALVKLLFPFRNWIPNQKVKNILKFEEINRERYF